MANHLTYIQTPKEAESFVAAQIAAESGRAVVLVMPSDRQMELALTQLAIYAPNAQHIAFPAWDCLPYDRSSPKQEVVAKRLSALAALNSQLTPHQSQLIVVTTTAALTQKLPPKSELAYSTLSLTQGQDLDRDQLMRYLVANGYTRVSKAMEPGEFSLRGNIIDLFPSGFTEGCRIDCFGDEIESMQSFDALSQRSTGEMLESLTLQPVSEVLLSERSIARFRESYRQQFGAISKPDSLYTAISEGHTANGMEHLLPLFYSKLDTLYDYLPEDALTVFSYSAQPALADRQELVEDYYKARKEFSQQGEQKYAALPPEQLFILGKKWQQLITGKDTITFSPFNAADGGDTVIDRHIKPAREFSSERREGKDPVEAAAGYIRMLLESGKQVQLACISEGSEAALRERLSKYLSLWEKSKSSTSGEGTTVLPLPRGFITPTLALLSEQDILGERRMQKRVKRRSSEEFFAEAANFSEGELVVHKEHGIGRFEGLVTMEAAGLKYDCLKLVYAENGRLFLPVENIDLISRYGDSGEEDSTALLDKLGGTSWQARKARLKERIKMAAQELLKIAAKRNLSKAPIFTPPEGLYEEFCRRFPYIETDDQLAAIDAVLEDFTLGKPADRLICGDVGFGKTEVAMRAAFVAATGGQSAQVALIAPTTLLVRQHTKSFKQRFAGLPVEVRQLSRLVSAKEKKDTQEKLAEGKVDIVIGTHALLSEKVKFKNLALLIVDEEQHFGVKQKEQLKKLRANMHVLTLSATPIPRTMQMALTGVRDLSLITTPPVDRLAIRTFVSPFDPVMIREAILREVHRGGQCFYVTPYVKDIAELKSRITQLVPEIRIAVAHGQMAAGELDGLMNDFYDGRYDVLMSTTIIESGIDVPTANTLIVNRADRFGLSQLYQIRGRVGRSKRRAYAYLTLPHHQQFTPQAMRRLEVMQTLDTLGAGFTVASHDMELRGFGNLVGEEQSGHIKEVGVELYQHMLEEAVTKARQENKHIANAEEEADDWRPQIKLGVTALLPEDYIEDLELRLGLYRRAAGLQSDAEIDDFRLELADRFGAVPESAGYFLDILKLKLRCQTAHIARIDAGSKGVLLSFYQNQVKNPSGLLEFISRHKSQIKIRPDQKLVITYSTAQATPQQKLGAVQQVVHKLAEIAAQPAEQAA